MFTPEQLEYLKKHFAAKGHHHDIEDVNGLEEALEVEDDDDEEDDEEEG